MTDSHRIRRLSRPRQEPVSCQLCRVKKLKCNREQPCSNCVARGVPCERQFRQPGPAHRRQPEPTENAAIMARLQKLEEIVLRQNSRNSNVTSPERISMVSRSPTFVMPSPMSEGEEAHKFETQRLEAVGSVEHSRMVELSEGLIFRICPIQQILKNPIPATDHQAPTLGMLARCISLPIKEEAVLLFEAYSKAVEYLQHILHLPFVRKKMDIIYLQLFRREPVEPSHVTLLMSMFATVALAMSHETRVHSLFRTTQEAHQVAILWAGFAFDVMEHTRRTTGPTLEDLQAKNIMGFLLYDMEGPTSRAVSLFGFGMAQARELGLHKLDVPQSRNQPPLSKNELIEKEIKRRVWWQIAATDWMIACLGGPQEGTYFAHPHQMRVNVPLNIDDEDLSRGNFEASKPLNELTSMSYFRQRIRLADICRRIADAMPISISAPELYNYQDIVSLDAEFEAFLRELPVFFQVDEASRWQSRDLIRQHPHLTMQRYVINLNMHIRRCKLHQPFLIRGTLDPAYRYSREAGLSSARRALEIKRLLDQEDVPILASHQRSCAVSHQIFLATTVLVMDLCFNKDEVQEEERKTEVREACRMLEAIKEHSSMAAKFLDSMTDVLRKYKVRLTSPEPSNAHNGEDQTLSAATTVVPPTSGSDGAAQQMFDDAPTTWDQTLQQDPPLTIDSDFEQIWQNYIELGPSSDMPDWDSLFSDLDSKMV